MIVNRIAEVATAQGKTVGEVSRETGLRDNTILSLFRGQGRRIDLDTLDVICRVLKAQPGDLFRWQPDATAPEPEAGTLTER